MTKERLFKKLAKDISLLLRKDLISLYVVGTAATAEHFEDIDLFAIVKTPFTKEEEEKVIAQLTKKHRIRIGLRTIAYNELLGKTKEASFIDDYQICLDGAKKLGMKTILFKNNKQLIKDLKKLGVLMER
jgi:hypothetical protein